MATVVTSDNVPAVLTQLVERLDEQDARIEALIALQTDQAIRDEERNKQFRVQAAALHATAAQLSQNSADDRCQPERLRVFRWLDLCEIRLTCAS